MYYGDDNEESIYKIIPPTVVKPEKPPMYKSSHKGSIPPTGTTFGQAGTSHPMLMNLSGEAQDRLVSQKKSKTFGKAPGSLQPDPNNFQKKRSSSVPSLPTVKR